MTEFLLATTLMWVTPQGATLSEPMMGAYATRQECTQALANQIEYMRRLNGVTPVSVGTELCVPREKKPVRPAIQKIIDDAVRAAREGAASVK